MGFTLEYPGLFINHLFHRAGIVFGVVRWVLSWALTYMGLGFWTDRDAHQQTAAGPSSVTAQMVRDSLHVATYGEISWRLPESVATCAVCLNELREQDRVRELRNCCHVFHKTCLDRWVDHDEHKTCPLCRAPLLGLDSGLGLERSDPSWAVERLLYLFGDDLPFASS